MLIAAVIFIDSTTTCCLSKHFSSTILCRSTPASRRGAFSITQLSLLRPFVLSFLLPADYGRRPIRLSGPLHVCRSDPSPSSPPLTPSPKTGPNGALGRFRCGLVIQCSPPPAGCYNRPSYSPARVLRGGTRMLRDLVAAVLRPFLPTPIPFQLCRPHIAWEQCTKLDRYVGPSRVSYRLPRVQEQIDARVCCRKYLVPPVSTKSLPCISPERTGRLWTFIPTSGINNCLPHGERCSF